MAELAASLRGDTFLKRLLRQKIQTFAISLRSRGKHHMQP